MLKYVVLICLQWLFLAMYHYTTNIHYCRSFRAFFGVGFFFIVVALWVFPQPTFALDFSLSLFGWRVSLINLLLGIPLVALGAYFGLGGVYTLGLARTSMLRVDRVICFGVYRLVRHPQYFGVAVLHLGFSVLFGGVYNLIYSPIMFLAMYTKALVEEKYLRRIFGREFEECFRDVPMFIPKLVR